MIIFDKNSDDQLLAHTFRFDPAASPLPTPTPTPIPADLGERSFVDRPDEVAGSPVHLIYMLAED